MNNVTKSKLNPGVTWLVYLIALFITIAIQLRHSYLLEEHSKEFREAAKIEAESIGHDISYKIQTLYQSLRTIARLPGTRNINRYGELIDRDTKYTLQEIYNNLYTNISLSEIYITLKGFDPDKIDPNTGVLSEPILTFDEFIVGRHAGKTKHDQTPSSIEEVEIHEYRLMRDQLSWLERYYPTESNITDLNYPAVSGPEVITCDNTFFSPNHPNDQDRSGLVYSVPFYGIDGSLKGIVSGVVLTKVLQGLIPNSNYVLINTEHNYVLTPQIEGVWLQSIEQIKKGLPDNSLFFSDVVDLPFVDKNNQWKLWVGHTQSEFYNSDEIAAYDRNKYISFLLVLVFAIGIHYIILQQNKRRSLIMNQNEYLERKVQERTQALTLTNDQLVKANDAKANFLSRVSHELRTPLNAIIGYSELLLDEGITDEKSVMGDLNKIQHSGKHLLSLINEVLDISKIEAGKMGVFIDSCTVKDIVDEIIATAKPSIEQNGNTLMVSMGDSIDTITTDKVKVKQILLNLLSNAAKFTHGGTIALEITSTNGRNGETIEFKVSDTGIGIDEDKLHHIFEEFYQAHEVSPDNEVGTGLGLAICKRLANLLQGRIQANSKPGCGSTFTLSLPKESSYCMVPSEVVVIDNVVQVRNVS